MLSCCGSQSDTWTDLVFSFLFSPDHITAPPPPVTSTGAPPASTSLPPPADPGKNLPQIKTEEEKSEQEIKFSISAGSEEASRRGSVKFVCRAASWLSAERQREEVESLTWGRSTSPALSMRLWGGGGILNKAGWKTRRRRREHGEGAGPAAGGEERRPAVHSEAAVQTQDQQEQ